MLVVMDRREQMRAADSDRAAVAEQLLRALNEGRLDLAEYEDRLQRVYAAKTYGDLNSSGLLDDLPGTVPVGQAQMVPVGEGVGPGLVPGPDGRYPDATRRWLAETWNGYLGVVTMVVTIWAITSLVSAQWLYFWPIWVGGPWGAVLLLNTVRGLANGEPQRWAARRAAKQHAKIEKRSRGRAEQAEEGEPA